MKRALATAAVAALVVGAYEVVSAKVSGASWGAAAEAAVKSPMFWGVAAAGGVLGFLAR